MWGPHSSFWPWLANWGPLRNLRHQPLHKGRACRHGCRGWLQFFGPSGQSARACHFSSRDLQRHCKVSHRVVFTTRQQTFCGSACNGGVCQVAEPRSNSFPRGSPTVHGDQFLNTGPGCPGIFGKLLGVQQDLKAIFSTQIFGRQLRHVQCRPALRAPLRSWPAPD